MRIHSQLPELCTKAAAIMKDFVLPELGNVDSQIPGDVITRARGIAVLQVVRAGFHVSGRFGSGVIVVRLPDGTWSAPSVIKTAGFGVGFVFGAEITDVVMILNTDAAVESFFKSEQVTLGGNLSVAAGPIGRNVEAGLAMSKNPVPIFSYSKTKGLFAGASLEGSAIVEGKQDNAAFYGQPIAASEICRGFVPRPQVAAELYAILELHASNEAKSYKVNPAAAANLPVLPPDEKLASSSSAAPPGIAFAQPDAELPPAYQDFAVLSDADYATLAVARPLPPTPGSNAGPKFYVAAHEYRSAQPGDLELNVGDVIRVTAMRADGWWTGENGKRSGLFPSNFVKPMTATYN